MQRELKMKELQLLDATRRKFLLYQQQQKQSELARLDDEIRRKVGIISIPEEFDSALNDVGMNFKSLDIFVTAEAGRMM